MSPLRDIKKILLPERKFEGSGVRFLQFSDIEFDPFLSIDVFDSKKPEEYVKGFPWHPHRGFEIITYIIDGRWDHRDKKGYRGLITSGQCHHIVAGSGIIHQEMPQPSLKLLGFRIWLNLPSIYKMVPPEFNEYTSQNIPRLLDNDAIANVISGTYKGVQGAFNGKYSNHMIADVQLKNEAMWSLETNPNDNFLIYVINGAGYFGSNNKYVPDKSLILFESGEKIEVRASLKGIRFLILSGTPIGETVVSAGPIVMNTKEEVLEAYKEIKEGTFLK